MRLIRSRPRYKCDFCNFKATFRTVEKHEKICFLNSNRFCPLCKNKGWTEESPLEEYSDKYPCPYCSKFEPFIEKIERETGKKIK